jgi:hypothetical protein
MSAFGTKQTSRTRSVMFAYGVKADIHRLLIDGQLRLENFPLNADAMGVGAKIIAADFALLRDHARP